MPVLIVQRLIGEEQLRHFAVKGPIDLKMNVRRTHITASGRIGARFDRQEAILSIAVGL